MQTEDSPVIDSVDTSMYLFGVAVFNCWMSVDDGSDDSIVSVFVDVLMELISRDMIDKSRLMSD